MLRPSRRLAALALATALSTSGILAVVSGPAVSAKKPAHQGHDHHDVGTMVDPYASGRPGFDGARIAARASARTVSVSPSSGPDFEMPFRCAEKWVGSTRSSHSPSRWTVDFNRSGDTGRPVLASARGIVYRVAKASGYGNYVIIDHGRGYSTLYAHLQAVNLNVGQVLDQGAVVGWVGSTGRVTGPHLHFEQRLNGNYFAPYFHRARFAFDRTVGSLNCTDTPIVGDWDGNGVDDLGVYRRRSGLATTYQRVAASTETVRYGYSAHSPFTGDWDGDRVSQLGTRMPRSTTFMLQGRDGAMAKANMGGSAKDIPLAGKWVRGAKSGIGLYSNATRKFTLRLPNLTKKVISFGASGTQPVLGDWNGDGVTDVGSFDPRTGRWRLRQPNGSVVTVTYGTTWDIPVTGDWNGDGTTDLGVWRPATAVFHQRVVSQPNTRNARAVTKTVKYGAKRG